MDPRSDAYSQSVEEEIATDFAADVLLNGKAEELAEECAAVCNRRTEWLKNAVQKVAARNAVREDVLANYLAYRLKAERGGLVGYGHGDATYSRGCAQSSSATPFYCGRIGTGFLHLIESFFKRACNRSRRSSHCHPLKTFRPNNCLSKAYPQQIPTTLLLSLI